MSLSGGIRIRGMLTRTEGGGAEWSEGADA